MGNYFLHIQYLCFCLCVSCHLCIFFLLPFGSIFKCLSSYFLKECKFCLYFCKLVRLWCPLVCLWAKCAKHIKITRMPIYVFIATGNQQKLDLQKFRFWSVCNFVRLWCPLVCLWTRPKTKK